MVSVNDYTEEKSCTYKNESYLVRDNGAVLRKPILPERPRRLDNEWTFGKVNIKTGYLEIASVRIHRIVATAFWGDAPTSQHVVDHIDTNRQNNRPDNLRWVTRLENIMLNPTTRKRIEYRTGVSIHDFLENPSVYRHLFDEPDFSWMRRVTPEEAKNCLANLQKWSKIAPPSQPKKEPSKITERIYHPQRHSFMDQPYTSPHISHTVESNRRLSNITDSLTPTAQQKDWRTPCEFVCCPQKVDGNPIACYLKNLSEGAIFAVNSYYTSTIIKFSAVRDEAIVVLTGSSSSTKALALAKITYENGYYIHANLGSFFTEEGAEKQFTLAQGLEWTGPDSIDDYL